MTKDEFIKLNFGEHQLTDGIHKYTLLVGNNDDGTKFYRISLKDSLPFSANIFITEKQEDGFVYLYGLSGVGALHIHSNDLYDVIFKLKKLD